MLTQKGFEFEVFLCYTRLGAQNGHWERKNSYQYVVSILIFHA